MTYAVQASLCQDSHWQTRSVSRFEMKLQLIQTAELEATHPDGQTTPAVIQTPSIAFRHLPPNSARFSYATEGALFSSA